MDINFKLLWLQVWDFQIVIIVKWLKQKWQSERKLHCGGKIKIKLRKNRVKSSWKRMELDVSKHCHRNAKSYSSWQTFKPWHISLNVQWHIKTQISVRWCYKDVGKYIYWKSHGPRTPLLVYNNVKRKDEPKSTEGGKVPTLSERQGPHTMSPFQKRKLDCSCLI